MKKIIKTPQTEKPLYDSKIQHRFTQHPAAFHVNNRLYILFHHTHCVHSIFLNVFFFYIYILINVMNENTLSDM